MPDMPIRTANHESVSHAAVSARQSFHCSTPVHRNAHSPIMAVTAGAIPNLSPAIHSTSAQLMTEMTTFSSFDKGPSIFRRSSAILGASGVSLISGGKAQYISSGVSSSAVAAGTHAPLSQVIQGLAMTMPATSWPSFMVSMFWAAAVMKRAEEGPAHCSWVWIRYAPSFLAEGSLGLLPALSASEAIMGRYTPPARAVVEGMAGAMAASLRVRP
mmetsp:Transcript_29394/g.49376  ORF Transcript_29394/g.49376 Transcript_29394/m.49376 type:complete len:215 (-) Transcript_29394:757-1401(-)